MPLKTTIVDIVRDLHSLGVREGDTLFLKVDPFKVGPIRESGTNRLLVNGLLTALLKAVGEEGTLVISAFTRNYFIPLIKPENVFDIHSAPNTGALARQFVAHPNCVRSSHPTNSFAAIGPKADYVLEGHDETRPPYYPMAKLIDRPSKSLIVGCVDSNPGFTTTHWAQYLLGHSRRSILYSNMGAYYYRDGKKLLFRRKEFGGHNSGAVKLYYHYVSKGILRAGHIGRAYSVIADTAEAFRIDYEVMANDPRYILCDRKDCFSCRGTWLYNKRDWLPFYLTAAPMLIVKKLLR